MKQGNDLPLLAIEARDLAKRFGAFTALGNLNLRIEKGIIYGLLGPNGAGKTTAIRILCGVLKPTSGQAYVFGKKVPDRSISPLIGYMPQDTALYLDLTVHQNMELYDELFDMPKNRIAEREGVDIAQDAIRDPLRRYRCHQCTAGGLVSPYTLGRPIGIDDIRRPDLTNPSPQSAWSESLEFFF